MPAYPEFTLPVRTYELDSLGHVNNAIYLNYLEAARVELLLNAELGLVHRIERRDVMPMLVRVEINYRKPAQFGDVLTIKHGLAHMGTKSFHLAYTIDDQNELRVADGKVVMVLLGGAGTPIAIPDQIRGVLSELPAMK